MWVRWRAAPAAWVETVRAVGRRENQWWCRNSLCAALWSVKKMIQLQNSQRHQLSPIWRRAYLPWEIPIMSPLTFSFSLLKVEKLAVRGSARSLWMYSKRVPSSYLARYVDEKWHWRCGWFPTWPRQSLCISRDDSWLKGEAESGISLSDSQMRGSASEATTWERQELDYLIASSVVAVVNTCRLPSNF